MYIFFAPANVMCTGMCTLNACYCHVMCCDDVGSQPVFRRRSATHRLRARLEQDGERSAEALGACANARDLPAQPGRGGPRSRIRHQGTTAAGGAALMLCVFCFWVKWLQFVLSSVFGLILCQICSVIF